MNANDFQAPAAGRLVAAPGGHLAFVPAPLPPPLEFSPELALLLSRADAALGELSGSGRLLPNPHLLIAPYLRREAVLSSRIEGTLTALPELLLDEAAHEGVPRDLPEDLREVRNYVAALEYGVQRLAELPLSLRLVRELHERLMRGVRGDRATPGEFRRTQNWIGPPGSTLATAVYVPPPPGELEATLAAWERFLHDRGGLPDLVQCALMHEQFEAIHPFVDGNGRVGRLLIPLFLMERQRLSQPLLYLSVYLESRRGEYYEALQRVRTRGDWTGWLAFFLRGVEQTARAALVQAGELVDLREGLRERLRDKPRLLPLVDALFENPYLKAVRAQQVLGVSNPTAQAAVRLLQERGILSEVTGRQWGRLFLARAVLAAIDVPLVEGGPTASAPS
ncbi:MAG: Fic family protein [Thermoanaerobaculia bacterium]